MSFPVSGKTALVTGAGSGICHSFAALLLSKGCNVLLADLKLRPEAQALVDSTRGNAKPEARAVFQETDVTSWADLSRAMAACVEAFGGIDIVCPGAGIFEPDWSSFWHPPGSPASRDAPDGNAYASFDINLVHPTRLTQLALAHFLAEKKKGVVVIVSSIAAQKPGPLHPLYAVTKAGMSSLVRSLAGLEEAVGVRVVGVAPAVVRTPMLLENLGKLDMLDQEKDLWTEPAAVAEAMLSLVEDPQNVGGTIVEVGPTTRKVELLNDPGPEGPGFTASNYIGMVTELFGKLKTEGLWTAP